MVEVTATVEAIKALTQSYAEASRWQDARPAEGRGGSQKQETYKIYSLT